MTNSKKKVVAEIFQQVIIKCWQDEAFKSRLVSDPVSTIKEVNPSFSMAKGKILAVRDQSAAKTIYINIPSVVDVENVELTEEELELVAGGGCITVPRKYGMKKLIDCVEITPIF